MHPPTSEFFTGFLASHMNRPLLEGYDGLSADFCIRFRDLDEHWNLRVLNGQIVAVAPEPAPRGSVCFEVDAPVFWEIVGGRVSPQSAFFARRTDIRGDLFLGMKLAKVLGLFFERFPYRNGISDGR